MNNGWIPNEDIEKYSSLREKKESLQNINPEEELRKDYSYKPSLSTYPLSLLKNLTEPLEETDVIFQFHIPKAAGTSSKEIFTQCFHLSRAEQISMPESYEIINHILNVDTSTIAGISRAKDFGIVENHMVDVVTSSHLHEGSTLLTEMHKGRLFVLMRHPVDTAISLFFYLGRATWESTHKQEFNNMTLYEYATLEDQGLRVDNWMTRYLSRKLKGPLDENDIQLAKDIISQKALIGLTEDYEESLKRFDSFHGLGTWPKNGKKCVDEHIHAKANLNKHQSFGNDTKEWKALAAANKADIEVFEFAQIIYVKQGEWIKLHSSSRKWNYRQPW